MTALPLRRPLKQRPAHHSPFPAELGDLVGHVGMVLADRTQDRQLFADHLCQPGRIGRAVHCDIEVEGLAGEGQAVAGFVGGHGRILA